jgi:hypothetical protein
VQIDLEEGKRFSPVPAMNTTKFMSSGGGACAKYAAFKLILTFAVHVKCNSASFPWLKQTCDNLDSRLLEGL